MLGGLLSIRRKEKTTILGMLMIYIMERGVYRVWYIIDYGYTVFGKTSGCCRAFGFNN